MKNNRGFTLIEIIITIAIIGIIIIPVFTIFNLGLKNIISAKERTEKVFETQNEINEDIRQPNIGEDATIKVVIPSLSIEKEVEGKEITVEKNNIKIITFVPNK